MVLSLEFCGDVWTLLRISNSELSCLIFLIVFGFIFPKRLFFLGGLDLFWIILAFNVSEADLSSWWSSQVLLD